jgi:biotin carboxyl carrier protein
MKRKFKVTVNGETFLVEVEEVKEGRPTSPIEIIPIPEPAAMFRSQVETTTGVGEEGAVTAPLPGVVSEVRVAEGDRVESGSVLLVLEAMKMENEIYAPASGVVREIYVEVGAQVNRGDRLVLVS